MKLRITKKEKPYIRIAYAMLYPRKVFKKNDRIKNNDKYGRISKIEKENVHIAYDDKTTEILSKKDASAILEIIDVTIEEPEIIKKVEKSVEKTVKKASPKKRKKSSKSNDRIGEILDLAVRKGEIEEDEVEIKRVELEMLSEEQLDEYEKKVQDSYDENISIEEINTTEEDIPMTDAERALAELRANGKAQTTKVAFSSDSCSRSLSEAKMDHDMEMEELKSMMNAGNVTKDGLTLDFGLENMNTNFMNKEQTFVRPETHSMQNLHGLKTPIVQQSNSFGNSLKDQLSNIEWTLGGGR